MAALFLLIALAAAATCAGGCGGGGDENASSAAERNRQLLEEIGLNGVSSGSYDAAFFVDNETKAVAVQWGAEGPFTRSGGRLQTKTRWEDAALDGLRLGTLQVLGNKTILGSGGKSYGLPTGSSEATPGCQAALEEIDFVTLVKNLRVKPEPALEITKIEGALRLDALLGALHRLKAASACGPLLEQAGLSPRALSALEAEVKSTFKKSEAVFTFGKDHILTQLSLGIWVESSPPKPEEVDGILTVSLSDVNEVDELGGPTLNGKTQEASSAQRSRAEGWIGLVDAVVGALAGPPAS